MKNLQKLFYASTVFLFLISIIFSSLFFASPALALSQSDTWALLGLSGKWIWQVAVDPTNSNIMYAATIGGMYKSTDAGTTWASINAGFPNPQNDSFTAVAIAPNNSNTIYASAFLGNNISALYKTTDAGGSWVDITNNIPSPYDVLDLAVDPVDSNIAYAGIYGNSNGFWKTIDGGASWTRNEAADTYRVVIDPTNHNTVYAGIGAGGNNANGVLKSVDQGVTWINPGDQGLNASIGAVRGITVDQTNPNTLYAGVESSGVYKSTDGGANWTDLSNSPSGPVEAAMAIDPLNSQAIYAGTICPGGGCSTVGVFQSLDGGGTWQAFNNGQFPQGINRLVIPSNNSSVMYAATTTGLYVYGPQRLQIAPLSNASINEGDTYSASSSFTDPNSNANSWTATVDYGDSSGTQPLTLSGMNFSLSHQYKDEGTYTTTVRITDNQGAMGSGTATITVNNALFSVGAISIPAPVVQVNASISASASYTDPGILDTHTASWNWGDGNTATGTVTESNGSGSVSNSHTYTTVGVYTVTLTVTDDDGLSNSSTFQYVSVYNPTAQGLFSAGQKFTSPAGAYLQTPSLTGDVKFGLSYKYQGTMPVGDRQFSMIFNQASLTFNATTVSSLVIANGIGTLTGTGTLNGSGTYNFLVTGSENTNTIRIQITDSSNNVIYDTQPGAAVTAIPTTTVTAGHVLAH